ncbi:MAG: hypothetical protein HBSIN02_18290 [Bacteroidia bacterium]|nr:MAG: hypothetical protein HBSIN02_18290 [Bacteroidia bacterium]
MYERCLNEAERILAADKDVIVAVKKVWLEVCREGGAQGFEVPQLSDFTAMLEGDPRFEFFPVRNTLQDDLDNPPDEDTPLEEAEMEQLGFFSGDRVKLKNVELTPTLLGTIIRSKVDRTMDALTKAWELRPEGDQNTEDRLLEILAKTRKLQQDVRKTFSSGRMSRIEAMLKKRRKPSRRKRSPAEPKKNRKQKTAVSRQRTPKRPSTRRRS